MRVAKYGQLDFPRLVERIRNRKPAGFTAMYDALGVYLDSAAESSGRKILVLFTDGANAVHVITPGRHEAAVDVVLDVPRVPVVDTVGAGDSFSGGFLAHWVSAGLGRADLVDVDKVVAAARYGIAVAGVTCQRPGADPPRAHEVGSDAA